MTSNELIALQKAGEVMVVDIREPMELAMEPALPGSVNIPISQLVAAEAAGALSKDKKIVTICASGSRCVPVTEFLKQKGYQVDYLEGGLISLGR